MPNHITNKLMIDALSDLELQSIRDFIVGTDDQGNEVAISLEQIRPTPPALLDEGNVELTPEEKRYRKMVYGAGDWYEWRLQNWGTKWNCYEVMEISDARIEFQTPWSSPEEIIKYLSKKFPVTQFHIEYADEDLGHNCGKYTYKDGQVTDSWRPVWKEEAMRFACSVHDYDYDEEMRERESWGPEEVNKEEPTCDNCASNKIYFNSSGEMQCDNCGYSETN